MAVQTRRVTNRRQVAYQSYDDLLADAERLAAGNVRTVGNWTFAQILQHLAENLHGSIDGFPFSAPAPVRVVAGLLLKRRFLNKTLPAGFKIPKRGQAKFQPPETTALAEALENFRRGIERCKSETARAEHPIFGRLTPDEWSRFELRHAELHMSFVLPVDS